MNKNARSLLGIVAYFVLAIFHAYLAEKRLSQIYLLDEFSAVGVIMVFDHVLTAILAVFLLLHNRDIQNLAISYFLQPQPIISAFLLTLSQACLMLLGTQLSFLFQLMLEASTVLNKLAPRIFHKGERIKRRDATFSTMYATGLLLFVLSTRGPFSYYIYFLLFIWIGSSSLSRYVQATAAISSNDARSVDLLVNSVWGFLFSCIVMTVRGEAMKFSSPTAVGDCFMVALFQSATTGVLFYFFGRSSSIKLGALLGVGKILRLLSFIIMFYKHLRLLQLLPAVLVLVTAVAETVMKTVSTQNVEVFDHKKERERAQTTYPPAPAKKLNY